MDTIHVLPVDDLKEHIETDDCECHPKIKYVEGGKIVVHNSYDGREFMEKWEEEKCKRMQ
jgi:hypothetical protein